VKDGARLLAGRNWDIRKEEHAAGKSQLELLSGVVANGTETHLRFRNHRRAESG
jgi:hypothetical protein